MKTLRNTKEIKMTGKDLKVKSEMRKENVYNEEASQNTANRAIYNKNKEETPLVSVIMPAYRCARTISQAIDSVLIQNVPLELIVINDCSPDALDAVMERYAMDSRVRYVKNEKNCGAAASRNRGVSMAAGKYIAFLDADDWWDPDKLEKQLVQMEKTKAVLCCTARELVTPDGIQSGRVIGVKEKITYRMLLHQNWINCSSVLLKAEVAKAFPMEHEEGHEDYILWLRILKKYGWAVAVNEPLLKYRLSTDGKSGNKLHSAKMTYDSYRYAGLGRTKAMLCFCAYTVNGIKKYTFAYLRTFLLQGRKRCDRISKNSTK